MTEPRRRCRLAGSDIQHPASSVQHLAMFEEPFRFVEAIANRREYIEGQLAGGSPIVALNYAGGILLATVSRERQKIFEIYDRIAMGAIGHPGDIERLRMAAIELASTEGFTRSSADVSLRRMANYSLSPALKSAFEQIYGAPYLARMIFVELGEEPGQNTFFRIDYDGAIHSNGAPRARARQPYAVLSGNKPSAEAMERLLARDHRAGMTLDEALDLALDAWTVGFDALDEDAKHGVGSGAAADAVPATETLRARRGEALGDAAVEAAVLENAARGGTAFRFLREEETRRAATTGGDGGPDDG